MTDRVEITDEMIERAHSHLMIRMGEPRALPSYAQVRAALEAALSPPDEIPVSQEMTQAGLCAYFGPQYDIHPPSAHEAIANAYRAMEKKRREEDVPKTLEIINIPGRGGGGGGWVRTRYTHFRFGDSVGNTHRRKDDPKVTP